MFKKLLVTLAMKAWRHLLERSSGTWGFRRQLGGLVEAGSAAMRYWLTEHTSIGGILRRSPFSHMRAYLKTETDQNDTTCLLLHQLVTIRRAIVVLHEYQGSTAGAV